SCVRLERLLVCPGIAQRTAVIVLSSQVKQDIFVQGIPTCSAVLDANWPKYTKIAGQEAGGRYPQSLISEMLRFAYTGTIAEKTLCSRKFYDLCLETDMT